MEQSIIDMHKIVCQIVKAVYHKAIKNEDYTNISYTVPDLEIQYSWQNNRADLWMKVEGISDFISISISPTNTVPSLNSVLYEHIDLYNTNRIKFSMKIANDNPLLVLNLPTIKKYSGVPLYCTEEELFQLSTVNHVPSMESIEDVRSVVELYNFVPKNVNVRVSFVPEMPLTNEDLCNTIIKNVWNLMNI